MAGIRRFDTIVVIASELCWKLFALSKKRAQGMSDARYFCKSELICPSGSFVDCAPRNDEGHSSDERAIIHPASSALLPETAGVTTFT
jgi:hypothetical protein